VRRDLIEERKKERKKNQKKKRKKEKKKERKKSTMTVISGRNWFTGNVIRPFASAMSLENNQ